MESSVQHYRGNNAASSKGKGPAFLGAWMIPSGLGRRLLPRNCAEVVDLSWHQVAF